MLASLRAPEGQLDWMHLNRYERVDAKLLFGNVHGTVVMRVSL